MSQIARGRTNQLGDFVRVLKLRAVHFDDRASVAKQYLRRSFPQCVSCQTRSAREKAGSQPDGPESSVLHRRPGRGQPAPARPLLDQRSSRATPAENRGCPCCGCWDPVAVLPLLSWLLPSSGEGPSPHRLPYRCRATRSLRLIATQSVKRAWRVPIGAGKFSVSQQQTSRSMTYKCCSSGNRLTS